MSEKQELALTGGALNASTLSVALTTQLWRLCEDSTDWKEAAQKIARNPALMAEARNVNSLAQRLAGPCGAESAYQAIQPLIVHFGAPSYGPAQAGQDVAAFYWKTYLTAVMELPRESLDRAVSDYIAGAAKPHFPKASELVKLAEKHAAKIRMIAWRIRKAVEGAPPERRANAEERKEVGASLADLAKQIGARPS